MRSLLFILLYSSAPATAAYDDVLAYCRRHLIIRCGKCSPRLRSEACEAPFCVHSWLAVHYIRLTSEEYVIPVGQHFQRESR